MGPAPESAINDVAKLIEKAKNPVILLGLMASQPANSAALRSCWRKAVFRSPAPIRPPGR
jgi:acetolactate synthase-1/2/3 large subunit